MTSARLDREKAKQEREVTIANINRDNRVAEIEKLVRGAPRHGMAWRGVACVRACMRVCAFVCVRDDHTHDAPQAPPRTSQAPKLPSCYPLLSGAYFCLCRLPFAMDVS